MSKIAIKLTHYLDFIREFGYIWTYFSIHGTHV